MSPPRVERLSITLAQYRSRYCLVFGMNLWFHYELHLCRTCLYDRHHTACVWEKEGES